MSFQNQHAKVLRIEFSVGNDDADRTIEQFEQALRDAVKGTGVHNVTVQGGYYIIDGKVCLAADYDPATKNRKPGTFPPVWAGGPNEAQRKSPYRIDTDDDEDSDQPREFVQVKPTKSREIDPKTGRRYRSDRGVKRGPRTGAAKESA